jgi:ATP-dependent DNA helicase RecQ
VPLLALSATCTQKIQKRVIKALALNDFTYVYQSPDKRNIKYSIKKVPSDIDMAWTWIVDGLMELGVSFPKTLIYCKSISDVAKIYDYITDEVSEQLQSCVGMFHSETERSVKEKIYSSIRDEQSLLRIIISTNAMGMGVDFKGLSNIVLFKPPSSMLDLVQEIGRAGRGGEKSIALLMYNSRHLQQCDSDVKKLYKGASCRRILMMEPFFERERPG